MLLLRFNTPGLVVLTLRSASLNPALATGRDDPEENQSTVLELPVSVQDTSVDPTIRLIIPFGVLAELCGFVVVVTSYFMTAIAVTASPHSCQFSPPFC